MSVQGAGGQAGKRTSAQNAEGARERLFVRVPVDEATRGLFMRYEKRIARFQKYIGNLERHAERMEGQRKNDQRYVETLEAHLAPDVLADIREMLRAERSSAPGTGASRKDILGG